LAGGGFLASPPRSKFLDPAPVGNGRRILLEEVLMFMQWERVSADKFEFGEKVRGVIQEPVGIVELRNGNFHWAAKCAIEGFEPIAYGKGVEETRAAAMMAVEAQVEPLEKAVNAAENAAILVQNQLRVPQRKRVLKDKLAAT
jgi:hypothetical protein